MGADRSARHALYGQWLSGNLVVADASKATGKYWYVDSGSATGADAGGSGRAPDAPFLTLDYAFGAHGAAANNGDVVIVMPGHAETIASAGAITMDLAGVSVIGIGTGADRPTFTFSATDSTIIMSAASLRLENILIKPSINAVVSPIVISGADCVIKNVEVQDDSALVECQASILTTAGAARLTIDGFEYRGFVTGDAATRVIVLVGVVNATIKNCKFWGEVSTAVINMETTLSTGITVHDCYFYNDNVALTKTVVASVGSCLWQATDCFDGKGGYGFSGSSTLTLAADDVSAVGSAVASLHVVTDTGVTAVGTAVASQHVVTRTGVTAVGTAVASEHVVTRTAVGAVTTAVASEHVVTVTAVGAVTTAVASEHVVTRTAVTAVTTASASEHVVTRTAVGAVTTAVASEHVVTVTAVGAVGTAVASEHTVTNAAIAAVPKCVEKSDGAVLAGADDLFDISGGPVFARIWGLVTTVFSGTTNLRLQIDVIEPAATVELNAGAVACNSQAAGSVFYNVGASSIFTPVTGGAVLLDPVTVEPTWFFLAPGTVTCLGDAARDGVIAWYMEFVPLSPSSVVAAAS